MFTRCDSGQRGRYYVLSLKSGQELLKPIFLFCYVSEVKMKMEKRLFT